MNIGLSSALGLGLVVIVAACASTPVPNAALENARSAVYTTEADPNVAQYAAVDLESAKKELAAAESAALNHDYDAASQDAYLAGQSARLAQLRAQAKADDAHVAAGRVERDRIQLAARNLEVQQAQAAQAQADAKQAQLQAEADALKAKQQH